ncbi:NADPH-dependent F420 reductase [Allosphingosinicella deserti]|uniref:NADP oxidoreductase n=1 Tax=Allosphingosinicella deserti TaxID=2116704 RepID=A0A2P7QSJ6_9SPHN|nr:NADPH-dependent F420 reductase [Sphingomonas deserti]PSJ40935.1 NADP oxidoreductase [Sphingomonas deserti]
MSYAIIGSGAIGSALARAFARKGIDVVIANSRGAASLGALTQSLGDTVRAAELTEALAADIVILAVPFDAVGSAVAGADAWNKRIVVDATNAIDFPAFTPRDLGGRPSSKIVAEQVPGARVVKAFNTIPAAILASDPADSGANRVLFVSGNEAHASQEVADLAEELGFAPIILGALDDGGRLQQFGGPLTGQNLLRRK